VGRDTAALTTAHVTHAPLIVALTRGLRHRGCPPPQHLWHACCGVRGPGLREPAVRAEKCKLRKKTTVGAEQIKMRSTEKAAVHRPPAATSRATCDQNYFQREPRVVKYVHRQLILRCVDWLMNSSGASQEGPPPVPCAHGAKSVTTNPALAQIIFSYFKKVVF
jgi:hypothetical protein